MDPFFKIAQVVVEKVEQYKGRQVKLHPNGFLQLSLSENGWREDGDRLHIWSPDFPKQGIEFAYHDHAFDFTSYVLLGSLEHSICEVEEDTKGDYTFLTGGMNGVEPTGKSVRLVGSRPVEIISSGERYSLQKDVFHRTVPLEWSVTLIKKSNSEGGKTPYLLAPKDYQPGRIIIDRTFDQDKAWAEITKACARIRERYL